MEEFYTIAENMQVTAEIVEKKSKFIANILHRHHESVIEVLTLNFLFLVSYIH